MSTTRTETRGEAVWTIKTNDDGSRTESTDYTQELASMDGGPPKKAVRMRFEKRFGPKGESWGWSRSDIGKIYDIQRSKLEA